jgi:hypothetical protein
LHQNAFYQRFRASDGQDRRHIATLREIFDTLPVLSDYLMTAKDCSHIVFR